MRILIKLSARTDAAYQSAYHNKLRGCIWSALEGSRYDDRHASDEPLGLSFSNIFPWGNMRGGDRRYLLIASPDGELLAVVADHFASERQLNVGEMPFTIEEITMVEPDVGVPGTRGVVETATGVLVRLRERHRERFGINGDYDGTVTFWRPEHTLAPFRAAVEANAQMKHELFGPNDLHGPADMERPLFDGYELIKTYALPVEVTTSEIRDTILSKWRFEYNVRDRHHRRHLNLLLDCGIGGRNALGFGFLNIDLDEKETPTTRPGRTTVGEPGVRE